jgi:phytanoyl-CoA hydroxylase
MKNTKTSMSNEWNQSNFEIANVELGYLNRAVNIYRKYGFVVLKNVIPADLLKKIHGELLFAFNNDTITNTVRDLHKFKDGTVSSAHNLVDYIPSYGELQKLKSIIEVVEGAYGKISTESFNSSYFAKPKLIGLETKPHQDNAFFCMEPPEIATCWIPIDNADRSNGALYYYPLTPGLGNIPHSPEGN